MFDDSALSQEVKDEMYKCYPNAKRAHLKSGGNFPYLSKSLDANIFIQVTILLLHGNIDQKLMNSLQGLLNFEIGR